MVAWQIKRGASGCLNFEELKRIVSVLSAFRWSLFSVFYVRYAGLESVPGVVIMFWTTWFAQLSVISKGLVRT